MNKKFSHMMATRPDRPPVKYKLDAVLNLSSKDLTEDEARVLARGFKFRPTLAQLPIKDIIISTEALIKTAKITPDVATRMRTKVAKEIDRMQDRERRRPTKQNLTTKEWKAVKNLKMDQERIIIPADKGDKSIVMDYAAKEDKYDAEDDATAILENQTYLDKLDDRIQGHIQVDQDPAIKHEKTLNAALTKMWKVGRNQEREPNQQTQLLLSRELLKDYMTQGAISPRLKGQLTDHKDEKPLREVSVTRPPTRQSAHSEVKKKENEAPSSDIVRQISPRRRKATEGGFRCYQVTRPQTSQSAQSDIQLIYRTIKDSSERRKRFNPSHQTGQIRWKFSIKL